MPFRLFHLGKELKPGEFESLQVLQSASAGSKAFSERYFIHLSTSVVELVDTESSNTHRVPVVAPAAAYSVSEFNNGAPVDLTDDDAIAELSVTVQRRAAYPTAVEHIDLTDSQSQFLPSAQKSQSLEILRAIPYLLKCPEQVFARIGRIDKQVLLPCYEHNNANL